MPVQTTAEEVKAAIERAKKEAPTEYVLYEDALHQLHDALDKQRQINELCLKLQGASDFMLEHVVLWSRRPTAVEPAVAVPWTHPTNNK